MSFCRNLMCLLCFHVDGDSTAAKVFSLALSIFNDVNNNSKGTTLVVDFFHNAVIQFYHKNVMIVMSVYCPAGL